MEGGGDTLRDYVREKRSHKRRNCGYGGRKTTKNGSVTDRKTTSGGQRKGNEEERRR